LQVAADSVGLALSGQDAAARNASGVTTKAVIKLDDTYGSDEDRALAARRVKMAMRDPENDGIPVLGPDEDIKNLELSAADKELLASRKFDREMIAAIYRVPPSKLQMLEFGVKANGQQQALDYRTDCLLHWGGMAEGQMALALLTERERRQGLFLRHDYSVLLEPTTQELYGALHTAIGGPFMAPNEGRRKARLQGDIGGGDALYPAPNMTRDADAPANQGGQQDGED
jgi:HK97 family phage portal protein